MIATRPLTPIERAERASPVTVTPPPSAAETMAAHMIDIAAANDGACLDSDLALRGWSPEELARHGAEANRIAVAIGGGRPA